VPESGISSLPKFVRFLLSNPSHQKISIKKDRNFLFFTKIPLGTTVVLDHPDTSRFARLNKEQRPMARANQENPYFKEQDSE